MRALIAASGDYNSSKRHDEIAKSCDLAIAADGGLRHLISLGVQPDFIIGDFDSISKYGISFDDIRNYEKMGVKVERLFVRKDFSDTEVALNTAVELGATDMVLIGAVGSRFDHSLFNVNLLFKLFSAGASATILDGRQELIPLFGNMRIKNREGMFLSVVPFSDLDGLSLKGFGYPLENANVQFTSSLTLSNVITSNDAEICLDSGRALVVISDGE